MRKIIIGLLICVAAFSACTKLKIKRAQKQIIGTYYIACGYSRPIYDSILGYTTQSGMYDEIWEIAVIDERHIMVNGGEYELVTDEAPFVYEGHITYASPPTVSFYPPDSITYRNWCCGHFGTSTNCTGKKK